MGVFTGKTAVVTGASSGIGRAAQRRCWSSQESYQSPIGILGLEESLHDERLTLIWAPHTSRRRRPGRAPTSRVAGCRAPGLLTT